MHVHPGTIGFLLCAVAGTPAQQLFAQLIIRDTVVITRTLPAASSLRAPGDKLHWSTLSYQFHPAGYCSATLEVWNNCGFYASSEGSGSSPSVVRIDISVRPLSEGPYSLRITRIGDYCGHRIVM